MGVGRDCKITEQGCFMTWLENYLNPSQAVVCVAHASDVHFVGTTNAVCINLDHLDRKEAEPVYFHGGKQMNDDLMTRPWEDEWNDIGGEG